MDFDNFDQFRRQVLSWYGAGRYQETLDLLEAQASSFPDEQYSTANWRMSMAARLGQTGRAIGIFRQSLDRGIWWAAQALREDPDLASLLGIPEFESLVEECQRREEEAVRRGRPEMLVSLPQSSEAAKMPLLIAVHGYGGNASETLESWKPLTAQGWLVAAVQSSIPIGSGVYGWSDEGRACQEICDHFRQLLEQYPVDLQHVVAGGFSQGGGLVVRMAIRQEIPMNGFIAVAPYLPGAEVMAKEAIQGIEQGKKPRGYLVVGGQDHLQDGFGPIAGLLGSVSVPHQIERHPETGHAYPPEFQQTLNRALSFIFQEPDL